MKPPFQLIRAIGSFNGLHPQSKFLAMTPMTTYRPYRSFHLASLLLCVLLACALPTLSLAATYTVTNINNSGAGSLRQAITDANANSVGTPHTINFSIASGGKTISPSSALPTINRDMVIDGRTQPGFSTAPLIEIAGTSAGAATSGFLVGTGKLTLYALIINRFGADGVRVDNSGLCDLAVYGCWIGTNMFGNVAAANGGHGINIINSSFQSSHRIGNVGSANRNVISGNTGDGIHVTNTLLALVEIYNNYIGLGMDGSTDVGNEGDGIEPSPYFEYDNDLQYYYGTRIGSTTAGTGNVISGNSFSGINIPFGERSEKLEILRNLIGTDANGTSAKPNGNYGILTGVSVYCQIGASGGNGNVISGNALSGIRIGGGEVTISGNFIGTNSVGGILGNGFHGIQFINGANSHIQVTDCTIGNNGLTGIQLTGNYNSWQVSGCRIGVTAAGADIGNGSDGIYTNCSSTSTETVGTVGFDTSNNSGAGNQIAYNNGAGVRVVSPAPAVGIVSNGIWDNSGLGIDVHTAGVTANDVGDTDTGPNGLQNFPVIGFATFARVAGSLDSVPYSRYRVEAFSAAADPTGYGEGKTYLGYTIVDTDSSGYAAFVVAGFSITPGTLVTTTATRIAVQTNPEVPNTLFSNVNDSSSEFSLNATAVSSDTGDFGIYTNVVNVSESTPSVTLTVNRIGGSTNSVSVDYIITPLSALAGSDYSGTGGTLTFQGGVTSRNFTIPIVNDALDEANEGFQVQLINPSGGPQIITDPYVSITITDDDSPPEIAITNTTLTEGNSGTALMTFSVYLSAPSGLPITVQWINAGLTATSITDFNGASGTVTFNPGETQKTVSISIKGDLTIEPDETLSVTLSSPTNATIVDDLGIGTILNDDFAGALQFQAATYSVDEVATSKSIFVSRSGGTIGTVTVNYTIAPGTATPAQDYSSAGTTGTLTFMNGETLKQIIITLLPDNLYEGNETIVTTLSNPSGGATLGTLASTTTTIIDDDPALAISGRVKFANGTGIPNVIVTLSGDLDDVVSTDASGYYSFGGFNSGGSYTITSSLTSYTFAPVSIVIPNLNATLIDQDFVGTLVIPVLYLTHNGNGTVTLKWSNLTRDWFPSKSLNLELNSWQTITQRLTNDGTYYSVTIPAPDPKCFYRLYRP